MFQIREYYWCKGLRKETIVALFKVQSRRLPGEAEENHGISRQNSRNPGRDLNQGPTQYEPWDLSSWPLVSMISKSTFLQNWSLFVASYYVIELQFTMSFYKMYVVYRKLLYGNSSSTTIIKLKSQYFMLQSEGHWLIEWLSLRTEIWKEHLNLRDRKWTEAVEICIIHNFCFSPSIIRMIKMKDAYRACEWWLLYVTFRYGILKGRECLEDLIADVKILLKKRC